jgi:teichuronic acid biosynthesis glycosyltransferase TuaC
VVSPVPYFPSWLKTKRWQASSSLPDLESVGELTVYHPRYLLLPKISMPVHALLMFLGSLKLCKALHTQAKFDCIDAHFVYPDGLAAVLLGKALGIPVVVSARGTDVNLYPSFRLIRPMIRWTLHESAAAIAVSGALKEKIVEVGCAKENIHVVPNGVDAMRFQSISKKDARAQLHLPEDGPLLLSVGSLIPLKGHELLIRAFSVVARQRTGLRLYILGEGTFRRKLESLITQLGLGDRVKLPGKRPNEELPVWFSAADISCLASEREGWPNVVTESLACGTPVVATRVGGVPEILHSPELGVLVERTVESISAGIEQALSRPWNHEAISIEARARTWTKVAAEVEEILAAQVARYR